MKISDLRQKSTDDLQAKLIELLKEQFDLRMQKASGQMSQSHLLGQVRKNVARVKTVLAETRDN